MIRGGDDIGVIKKSELIESRMDAGEVVIGVADCGERGRAVNAGREHVEAVALIMLGAVRIARPEHQNKRFVAFFEHRQHDAGGHRGKIVLLHDIGAHSAGLGDIAGSAIGSARRRDERQTDRF